jgi:hypothetical protein
MLQLSTSHDQTTKKQSFYLESDSIPNHAVDINAVRVISDSGNWND